MERFDPFWTPLLSHYSGSGFDPDRTRRHIASVVPHVRQYLIGGTTGDGWAMPDPVLRFWLGLVCREDVFGPSQQVLVGAFGATAAAVIERAALVEEHFLHHRPAAHFAGLTLCAPVDSAATQAEIKAHFRAILAATAAPVAIYQLPQITGCTIAPETLAELVAEEPRIVLFKDTSGTDAVARSELDFGKVRMLRGAEGDYAAQLKPAGPYDGWLLSTGNGFAPQLRAIAEAVAAGATAEAQRESERLTRLVEAVFALAAPLGGNAFADANRAVDHLNAFGRSWRWAPSPIRADGSALPGALVAGAAGLLERAGLLREVGYLHDTAGGGPVRGVESA